MSHCPHYQKLSTNSFLLILIITSKKYLLKINLIFIILYSLLKVLNKLCLILSAAQLPLTYIVNLLESLKNSEIIIDQLRLLRYNKRTRKNTKTEVFCYVKQNF